jgi:O-antigen/teichoic acid export membrane protein
MFYGIAGSVTGALRVAIDSIVLAGTLGLGAAGIFTLANFAASLLQAPLRSLISITIPLLAQAWKDKNLAEIDRIYKRSAINLLIFSLFIFGCIWLSFEPAITYLHLDEKYLQGKNVLLILGVMNIIEMGTGVNGQIIGTSTSWRFEFYTNLLLGAIITILSYTITKYTGARIAGPAIAQLIGVTVYNAIRVIFLKRKFNLMPFTNKTGLAILLFIICVLPGMLLQSFYPGLLAGILGVLFFILTMPIGVIYFQLSPDVLPIVDTLLKRLGINKKFEK